ncbi:hypothetical protein [Paracoccus mutanolyticus]|uniref:hypothetical protein n=1 Tax=Paracoccus mutanolyticus TaxID=1499308 RepID=UPI0016766EE2|nr:hypothetical protein [Paracoccus mutanolyticus]
MPLVLEGKARRQAHRTALRFGDTVLSYEQLHQGINRFANGFLSRGCASGAGEIDVNLCLSG